jgi:hypothetical protein
MISLLAIRTTASIVVSFDGSVYVGNLLVFDDLQEHFVGADVGGLRVMLGNPIVFAKAFEGFLAGD